MLLDIDNLEYFEDLSRSEKAHFRQSLNLYKAVMLLNYKRAFNTQSPREKKRFAIGVLPTIKYAKQQIKKYESHPDDMWWEQASSTLGLQSGGVSSHSALFLRLLRGKMPLRFLPPCNGNFPWYELIEESGPHEIKHIYLDPAVTVQRGRKFNSKGRNPGEIARLVIHSTSFSVTEANEAARDLLSLCEAMPPQIGYSSNPIEIRRARALMPLVIKVYEQKPEMRIKFDRWPEFRLHLATSAPYPLEEQHVMHCLSHGDLLCHEPQNPLDLATSHWGLKHSTRPQKMPPKHPADSEFIMNIRRVLEGTPPIQGMPLLTEHPWEIGNFGVHEMPLAWCTRMSWFVSHSSDWSHWTTSDIHLPPSELNDWLLRDKSSHHASDKYRTVAAGLFDSSKSIEEACPWRACKANA